MLIQGAGDKRADSPPRRARRWRNKRIDRTVEELVQSCCRCAAVAFCCGNSPLGPQRRIAAAQAQIDSNPALHGLVRGILRLPSISFSRAFLCDLERTVTRFFRVMWAAGNCACYEADSQRSDRTSCLAAISLSSSVEVLGPRVSRGALNNHVRF